MMRSLIAAALAAMSFAAVAAPAQAEVLDASTFTCKEVADGFASSSRDEQYGASTILYWMAGYHATEEQGTVVDFDGIIKGMEKTVEFCAQNPSVGVMSASAKFMGKNLPQGGKESIDLAIMKCSMLQDLSAKDEEGLGQILMWLSGYHASGNGEKTVDTDEFQAASQKIGTYCGENPEIGFVTASEEFMADAE